METWRKGLEEALTVNGEAWGDIEASTLTEEQLDEEFDDGFGGSEGCPFTVWTRKWVYFPCVYDGAEWVESVSRHPDGVPTEHVGGQ